MKRSDTMLLRSLFLPVATFATIGPLFMGCGDFDNNEPEFAPLSSNEEAILNGFVDPSVFPQVVQIQVSGIGTCSATVLTSRHLITAAHCLNKYIGTSSGIRNVTVTYDNGGLRTTGVFLGSRYRTANWRGTAATDIGLIQLNAAMINFVRGRFQKDLQSVPGAHLVVGYGWNAGNINSGTGLGTRRFGVMQFENSSTSALTLKTPLSKSWVALPGDSGGAAIVSRKNGSKRYINVGVTSKSNGVSRSYFSRIGIQWPVLFGAAITMGRKISCGSSIAEGVPYYYGCTSRTIP